MTFLKIASAMRALASDQKGVTAIEYGVIASAIVVAIIATVGTVGTHLTTTFATVSSAL